MTAAAACPATTTSGLGKKLMKGLNCQTAQTSSGRLQVAKKPLKMAQYGSKLVQIWSDSGDLFNDQTGLGRNRIKTGSKLPKKKNS